MKHQEITQAIIGAAFKVHNTLGNGFLEKVCENALAVELKQADLDVVQQRPIKVYYGDVHVGDYVADLVVEGKVIVETKAGRTLDPAHEAQLINYLKATGIEVGLLLNFGDRVAHKRKIFDRQPGR